MNGHWKTRVTMLPSERPTPQPPQPDTYGGGPKPPAMPPGNDPRAGHTIPSMYYTPPFWECVKRLFRRAP